MESSVSIEQGRITPALLSAVRAGRAKAVGAGLPALGKRELDRLCRAFPEGQLAIHVDGALAAIAVTVRLPEKAAIAIDKRSALLDALFAPPTGPAEAPLAAGDTLFVLELWVDPQHRRMRLGQRLLEALQELCDRLNLRRVLVACPLDFWPEESGETPKRYVEQVRRRERVDVPLSFFRANDFGVRRLLSDFTGEPAGNGLRAKTAATAPWSAMLDWPNPYYQEPSQSLGNKTNVRLGLVQWQMRPHDSLDSLMTQVEFFVDALARYKCDFLLLPEFFNAPLMAAFNSEGEARAMRLVARHTEPIRDRLLEMAVSYNINIIGGSMPLVQRGKLTNVGYLCRRDGSWERYEKLHITPAEAAVWGLQGGTTLNVFDTDAGKIGVLICYDSEFPELGRLLADQGMQILFVPFQTDTQNGYVRVRHCCQARAIENECFVAITGSVGNLPKVENMDIQYAQSAVFTPSDFAFPTNGVKAETTPNTEMTLVVDVDLSLLQDLHTTGSVRNLRDRRRDLFELKAKKRLR